MPPFEYTANSASVHFPAHKFPYSPTVYYACSVRFCQNCLPPVCKGAINVAASGIKQHAKRDAAFPDSREVPVYEQPATIEVIN